MSRLAPLARAARRLPRRTVVAGGSVLVVAALVTTAAFTDSTVIRVRDGLRTPEQMRLEVKSHNTRDLSDDGSWRRLAEDGEDGPVQPAPGSGATVPLPRGGTLSPGGEPAVVHIPVRNTSGALDATVQVGLLVRGDLEDPTPSAWAVRPDGTAATVGEANAAYVDALLVDVLLDDELVADDLPVAHVPTVLGALPAGTARLVTVEVRLPDDGDLALVNGGVASLTAHLTATT
ncbi:hypothetical protein [Cellulomonas pakistanensis]|uniref:Uncharacterized protein n=1 Tax=Cellulomonas pakistanensis TaxID=992287 RepID=A0A919PAG5_9CELL|nr:hypothetical protein [Cellulomonas pakistanensis]GIG36583.1 hypothetical protein Cpa01nite_19640 [Cellulomonas pakistanensis]